MRPLNVWVINHYAGNPEIGMEYRHHYLCRHLNDLGYRASILSASFHHLHSRDPEVEGNLTFRQVGNTPTVRLRVPRYRGNGAGRLLNIASFSLRLASSFRKIEERFGAPEVILGSSPHPFVTFNLLHLRRRYGVPVIFEVRDPWPLILIELGSLSRRHPLSLLFDWLERKALRESDRVISLWSAGDRYLCPRGLDPDRYVYLPNGIDWPPAELESGELDDAGLLEKIRRLRGEDRLIVLYAGSHGLANPLPTIVDACRILQDQAVRDVVFLMVGDGPRKEATVARARQLGLQNLVFHPSVPRAAIQVAFREVDVMFMGLRSLPSFQFGPTPNKLMDYLASGKPIIHAVASPFDPVSEVGAGISIPPDEPRALADAILALRDESCDDRAAMGRRGRDFVRSHLTFAGLARKLGRVLDEVVDRR